MKKDDDFSKEEIIKVLQEYYTNIGRGEPHQRPQFEEYTLKQLNACLRIFNIQLSRTADD
jgi:hypothetical protein